jgi:exopolysaccharide biosynthesis polyprenyl glycosylphosphotransferase
MKNNASLVYNIGLVVGDFLALAAAFTAAYLIRSRLYTAPVAHPITSATYLSIFLALLPFWLLIFALLGLYNNSIYEKRFQELGRLFIGSFVGLLFVLSYAYIDNNPVFPAKTVPVYAFLLGFLFLVIFRNIARDVRIWLFKYNVGITNLLIIGDTSITRELVEALADSRESGYRIVGVVGSSQHIKKHFSHLKTFANFSEAVKAVKADDIHSIVQTELFASAEDNNEILEFAQTFHIAFRFVPGNSELFVGNIAVELFRSSVPVIAVHQTALIGWGRVVKRVMDIVLSLILLIPGLPIMLVIATLMKLFDPRGTIIYKDARLTRYGTVIKVFKFRSLKKQYNGLLPEQAFAKMGRADLARQYRANGDFLDRDPRISRIGRFLRRTSLDELPQLFNILRGDISFVGPRALNSIELGQYAKKDLILAVKSGLTGLAQVSGRRDISVEERRKLDLYYVQNWSLWLDLIIIIKTIRVVFSKSGAK